MSGSKILSVYDDVLKISNLMLEAAKQQDWQSLKHLEIACKQCIDGIGDIVDQKPLTPAEIDVKAEFIKKILTDDRDINDLIHPDMSRIAKLIRPGS